MEGAFAAFDNLVHAPDVELDELADVDSTSVDNVTVDYIPCASNPKHKILISKSGAFISFDSIAIKRKKGVNADLTRMKAVRKIENYFTLKTMQVIGAMKQTKRCRVDKKKRRIIVPRFGLFEVLTEKYGLDGFTAKSCLTSGEPPNKWFRWQGALRPNQQLILNYMMQNIYTDKRKQVGSAGCILDLEAGQGKSYLAAYLMSKFNKKTAIILHSTSLIDQWKDVIKVCYGDDITVGEYYGKKKTDGDVVLIIINSVLSSEFVNTAGRGKNKVITKFTPIEYFSQFGFIIYDEAHVYANKNAGKAFSIAQAPYMLGLRATPDENAYKFDKLVWWGIGPVLTAANLTGYIPTNKDFSGEVHRKMYYGKPNFTRLIKNETTDMVSVTETISMICKDADRTALVVDCILECLDKKLYTFVFADRRDYLDVLRLALIARHAVPSNNIEMLIKPADYMRIVGGSKNEELATAEFKSKVIFTTYQYMGTGKSIVKMNGLVLATPRKSKMKQYIKRIFRLGSDTSVTRHIYDIVDMKVTMKNQWSVRKKYYNSQEFKIIETKHVSGGSAVVKSIQSTDTTDTIKKSTKKSKYQSITDKLRAKLRK